MIVEKQMECRLAGETEILGENLPQQRLGLPSGLFPSGFPTNILHAFLLSPIPATYLWSLFLRYCRFINYPSSLSDRHGAVFSEVLLLILPLRNIVYWALRGSTMKTTN
jgi:hypothetical protein